MLRSLKRIQENIPHRELSIHLDCPADIGMLEDANFYGIMEFKPWFEPVAEGVLERMVKIADSVAEYVELGFHLCYGSGHESQTLIAADREQVMSDKSISQNRNQHLQW